MKLAPLLVALAGCLICSCSSPAVRADASTSGDGEQQPGCTIASIQLRRSDVGEQSSRWAESRVTITARSTIRERASSVEPAARTEGRTPAREWSRLCQFVCECGLFSKRGHSELQFGAHAGDAEITVTFSDGGVSTVAHRAFNSIEPSTFWTVVRVIEGSALDVVPLSDPPDWSR